MQDTGVLIQKFWKTMTPNVCHNYIIHIQVMVKIIEVILILVANANIVTATILINKLRHKMP